jgi:monovalent cation:H+ antiporter, CPA1 family
MSGLTELLVLLGCLLGLVTLIQVAAVRIGTPESTLLSLAGIALGASYVTVNSFAPEFADFFFSPLVNPVLPAEAYLWLFLPPLLFQVALTVDVRSMLQDAAPILLLAVVAVFVATGVIGFALASVAPKGWVVCLLVGAIVATTDPAAVIGIFREVGAPGRLIRLVEGESLLNDAAAIALVGVLTGMLTGGGAEASWSAGLRELSVSFGGGVLLGVVVGRLVAFLLPMMNNIATAETALTLAVPYPLFLFGNEVLDISGVVAVVCAALVINGLARTRLTRRNSEHLQLVWAQIAALAGAIVFLLAAVRVPHLLHGVNWTDVGYLLVAVAAAFAARLAVLFLMLPVLSRFKLSEPISPASKLAIAWGGLRGAVTLVLAMGVAENTRLPLSTRHFISIMATGFVLFSLLINGSTLRWVIRRLGLDRLSPQEQVLQQQAILLSTEEVEATVKRIAATFHIPAEIATRVNQHYRQDMAHSAALLDHSPALTERERLAIGLVTLATREHELIPDYGNGIVSVRNLDAMMSNTGHMIDAARTDGRLGYNRASLRILEPHPAYKLGLLLHRLFHWDGPLASALADRYELMICRRAVLERLREYNQSRVQPLLGARMSDVLDSILMARIRMIEKVIHGMRIEFGDFTTTLEQRILLLFALRQGRSAMESMVTEQVVSKEVYNWVRHELDQAWGRAVERPALRPVRKKPQP